MVVDRFPPPHLELQLLGLEMVVQPGQLPEEQLIELEHAHLGCHSIVCARRVVRNAAREELSRPNPRPK